MCFNLTVAVCRSKISETIIFIEFQNGYKYIANYITHIIYIPENFYSIFIYALSGTYVHCKKYVSIY